MPLATAIGDPMTKRQLEIHSWIAKFLAKHSYAPSVRELCDAFEIKSPNGIICHLTALRKKGLVTWVEGQSRTLVAIQPEKQKKKTTDAA